MTAAPLRPCDHCGDLFKAAKPWQRFCSSACRMNAHGAARYADGKKARLVCAYAAKELAGVEAFLAIASPASKALATVRRVIKRAKAV